MRTFRIGALVTMLTALGGACGDDPTDAGAAVDLSVAYGLAYHHDDCAPWDGPAVSLYFVRSPMEAPWTPGYPHLRVAVYETEVGLVDRVIEWGAGDHDIGYAERCTAEGACDPATRTRIEGLTRDAADGSLGGTLTVDFADGVRIRGSFRAQRIDVQPLCG